MTNFKLKPIGVIRTPYIDNAPYHPIDEDKGKFRIVLDVKYSEGLLDLYFYILKASHTSIKENLMPKPQAAIDAGKCHPEKCDGGICVACACLS